MYINKQRLANIYVVISIFRGRIIIVIILFFG